MTELQLHYAEMLVGARFGSGHCDTFVVVVFYGQDSSPGGTRVVDDGFDIQWFDCEGVDDPDGDPLCKFS